MDKLFGTKKAEAPKPTINAPTLGNTSKNLDARGKVVQAKVDECNVELAKIKNEMKTAKGARANQLKQKAL